MLTAIFEALVAIPKIVGLIQGLIEALLKLVEEQRKANLLSEAKAAIQKAIETKNTSELEKLYGGSGK